MNPNHLIRSHYHQCNTKHYNRLLFHSHFINIARLGVVDVIVDDDDEDGDIVKVKRI